MAEIKAVFFQVDGEAVNDDQDHDWYSDRGSDEGNINLVRTVRFILIANFNMSVFIFSASFLELLTMAHSPPAPPCLS